MPRADLHHDVPGFHHQLAIVELDNALARKHDSVVHRLGLVHCRAVEIVAAAAIPCAASRGRFGRVRRHQRRNFGAVGRMRKPIHDAQMASARRSRKLIVPPGGIVVPRERRRRFPPDPAVDSPVARDRGFMHARRRAIPNHFRFAAIIVSGDHSPDRRQCHDFFSCHAAETMSRIIFPGFIRLNGSSAVLMVRITDIPAPCSRSTNSILP